MAGAVLQRELTARPKSRVRFAVATAADDAGIRRLLRETPMHGRIRVTLEHEPDYFADAHQPGETRQTIVAREGNAVVCVGNCSIRPRFVNGVPRRVGYLGGLRLAAGHAGRADILRRGYAFFRHLQAENPADYYFTSIAADNQRARKFLESSAPGMPRYEFVEEFVTLIIAVNGLSSRGIAGRDGRGENSRNQRGYRQGASGYGVPPSGGGAPDSTAARKVSALPENSFTQPAEAGTPYPGITAYDELAARINDCNRDYQFAPDWTAGDQTALDSLGLTRENFHCLREGGQILAGAALWDQRNHKQTVIHGYSPALSLARPVVNLLARLRRQPRLPAAGETLKCGVASHLFVSPDQPAILIDLINHLRSLASARRLEMLMLGFDARDPRLPVAQRAFRGREYCSRLYVVRWPDLGGSATELDGRPAAPDLALL